MIAKCSLRWAYMGPAGSHKPDYLVPSTPVQARRKLSKHAGKNLLVSIICPFDWNSVNESAKQYPIC